MNASGQVIGSERTLPRSLVEAPRPSRSQECVRREIGARGERISTSSLMRALRDRIQSLTEIRDQIRRIFNSA